VPFRSPRLRGPTRLRDRVTDADQDTLELAGSTHSGRGAELVGLTLLLHPDVSRVGEVAILFSTIAGGRAQLSRLDPAFCKTPDDRRSDDRRSDDGRSDDGRPLGHPLLSRQPIVIRTDAAGDIVLEPSVSPSRCNVDGVVLDAPQCLPRGRLRRGVVLELADSAVLLLHLVSNEPEPAGDLGLVGNSLGVRHLRRQVLQVADSRTSVLIRGESGSGKELAARAIHAHSLRRAQPFIAVNAAAIPAALAAAALFGHAKGAFTGANQASKGYFGQAHGGTLFLDEVGELPRELQALLLRATREGEIQPVGEDQPRRVDVRVLAATDADLESRVERGDFSMPLLRRLEAYTLELPPLRARRDDIARLLIHFLRLELAEFGELEKLDEPRPGHKPWLRSNLVRALLDHPWPGNVAELQSVARHIAITNRGQSRFTASDWLNTRLGLEAPTLAPTLAARAVAPSSPKVETSGGSPAPRVKTDARSLTDAHIVEAMARCRFNVARAAELLSVSRSWLHTRLEFCVGLRQAKELESAEILAAAHECDHSFAALAERLRVSEHGLKLRMAALGLSLPDSPAMRGAAESDHPGVRSH
jgi:two-component system, NtrC family, nitrogen regulation response regulator GlnG